ncbi:hypothetical protein [Streptomyces sp. NBC_00233]|uniref:hypothetical protein n=1 Tax=Streptomyces sp. NBC_00233 TaxID=2975686 RepID=UPI002252AD15|nr:hypothetical protein [Streptomyces sp. NBC_00233]MCX5230429.1 hypothetical protein [Streptomyces sp. NBC_00233]
MISRPGPGHDTGVVLGSHALRLVPAPNQGAGGVEHLVEHHGYVPGDGTLSTLEAP